jgi:SAM-dependent methyltransferase
MPGRDPKKFDPARAPVLDAPERERYLPTDPLVTLLDLHGDETVVDYGAGTGRLAVSVAERLTDRGHVLAVDSSAEMIDHLRARASGHPRVVVAHVTDDAVPLADGGADRVLAVNVLHEVRGERAVDEMRRLVAEDGFVVVVDWERGRPRDLGPPDELLYDVTEASTALAAAGLRTTVAPIELPFHFALIATPID